MKPGDSARVTVDVWVVCRHVGVIELVANTPALVLSTDNPLFYSVLLPSGEVVGVSSSALRKT